MSAPRGPFIRPTFEGQFVLVDADVAVAETGDRYDGPFVAAAACYDRDNATVFVGDGLPFRIGVVAQDNDVLTLHDASRVRIVPWPICTSSQRETDPLSDYLVVKRADETALLFEAQKLLHDRGAGVQQQLIKRGVLLADVHSVRLLREPLTCGGAETSFLEAHDAAVAARIPA